MERNGRATPWIVLSGALAGALAAYLLGTPRGRRLCDQAMLMLDDFSYEYVRLCEASMRVRIAAANSWKALEHAVQADMPIGGTQYERSR